MFKFFGAKIDGEKLKDEMIAHLEAKYKKKFYPILLEPRGFQINYDKLKVYAEGDDKETDVAHIARFGDKKEGYRFKDNYFGIHIRPEFEALVEKEVKKVFDDVKVFSKFWAHSFPDELICDNTYKDAINLRMNVDARLVIYLGTQNSEMNLEEKSIEMEKLLEKSNIRGNYRLFHLKPGKFEDINRKNYDNYVKEFTKQFDEVCYQLIERNISKNTNK